MSRSVYLDANVLIYYFDRHPVYRPLVETLFDRIIASDYKIHSTTFCLGEVLVRPVLEAQEFKIARIKLFFRSPGVVLLDFPPEAVQLYAELRARHRVKSLDALHLAAAAYAGTDLFLTNDRSLLGLTVPGIGAVAPIDYAF